MALFNYTVRDAQGNVLSGEMAGGTRAIVIADLRRKGLTVIRLDERRAKLRSSLLKTPLVRISPRDKAIFARQFATMMHAGIAALRALTILEQQTRNPRLRVIITAVRADVEAGTTLSAALATHPIAFDRLCVAMVNAGEAGGTLDDALSRVAVRLERDDRLRRSIKSALAYPTLIAGLAIAVMIGMMMFVIPVFGGMYRDLGSTLPLLTRAMLSTSGLLTSYWFVIFPSMVLMSWATLRFIRTELGRHVWDRAKLRLPLQMGAVVQKVVMARFSRTLATLVTCGVPILQAIDITGGTAGNAVIEQSMIAIRQRVRNGEALAVPLRSMPVFPPMVTQMIAVGEETGALDTMLHKVADFYEDEVEAAVKSLTSIIEPVMMIGVGAVVGVVVIGMYLPIFNMIQLVR